MSLIKCPECGKRISDEAEVCIQCGYPVKAKRALQGKPSEEALMPFTAIGEADSQAVAENEVQQSMGSPEEPKFRNKRKKLFYIAGTAFLVILAALSFYLFYYRPHYVPRAVENTEYTIQYNGLSYDCSFSGTMLNSKPQGAGRFVYGDDSSKAVFEGELVDGVIFQDGQVSNLPVSIETYDGQFEIVYTGEIVDGELIDAYNVSAMPLSVMFDGRAYNGFYSGEIKGNTPNGTGSFTSENKDKYFEYTGTWLDGKLKGEGQLNSNDIIAHLSEVDRKGEYNGSVVDGVFCGQGTFSATTDDGIDYTYEGEWKDGKWDGQGKQIYHNSEDLANHLGTFRNGNFEPTIIEFLDSYGTRKVGAYSISRLSRAFIEEHEELFTKNTSTGTSEYIDPDFSYAKYSKNVDKYGDALFKISGLRIIQVFERDDYWGRRVSIFLVDDRNYNLYYGILFNSSALLIEGKRITLTALPLDFSTYDGVDGNKHWAIRFVAVNVE